ncbi:MAG: hypothetical protein ACTSU9_00590 [Promethearchaeota archaeon]
MTPTRFNHTEKILSIASLPVLIITFITLKHDLLIIVAILQAVSTSLVIFLNYYVKPASSLVIACTEFVHALDGDPEWVDVKNAMDGLASRIQSTKSISYKSILITVEASIAIMAISLILALILDQSIFLFSLIAPCFLVPCIAGLKSAFNIDVNPMHSLKIMVETWMRELDDEYDFLSQYTIDGTEQHFKIIQENITRLKNSDFLTSIPADLLNPTITRRKIFELIKSRFTAAITPITGIYTTRGMFATLSNMIIKLREIQIKNLRTHEKEQERDYYLSVIETLDAKEDHIKNFSEQAMSEFKEHSREFKQEFDKDIQDMDSNVQKKFRALESTWDEKIRTFEKKISDVYDGNYQKFGKLNDELFEQKKNFEKEFNQLKQSIIHAHETLLSTSTSLFFERFYLDLLKESKDGDFFITFSYIADKYLDEIIQDEDEETIKTTFHRLCQIRGMLNAH